MYGLEDVEAAYSCWAVHDNFPRQITAYDDHVSDLIGGGRFVHVFDRDVTTGGTTGSDHPVWRKCNIEMLTLFGADYIVGKEAPVDVRDCR